MTASAPGSTAGHGSVARGRRRRAPCRRAAPAPSRMRGDVGAGRQRSRRGRARRARRRCRPRRARRAITAGRSVGRPATFTTMPSGARWRARCCAHSSSSSSSIARSPSPTCSRPPRRALGGGRAGEADRQPPARRPPSRRRGSRPPAAAPPAAAPRRRARAGSSLAATTVAVRAGAGCRRTATRRDQPERAERAGEQLARGRSPATFLITLPPDLAIVPSDSTTVMPTTRSRTPP